MAEEKIPLTVIILTKNVEASLEQALESVNWVAEIIIVDNGSTDDTIAIAERYTSHIFKTDTESFAEKRNVGMRQSSHDWVFYLDADEVVGEGLKSELVDRVKQVEQFNQDSDEILSSRRTSGLQNDENIVAFTVKRRNFFLGKEMYQDKVHRLFYKPAFKQWMGNVQQTPEYEGKTGELVNPLVHHTHTDITSMLDKTNHWSEIEAQIRIEANHPPMAIWRMFRVAMTIFWQQLVGKRLWKYGREGWFEAYFQVVDKMIVYTKLWERQQSNV